MTIIETKLPQKFANTLYAATGAGKECLIYIINQFVCVWSGVSDLYDKEYCIEHNIDVEYAEYVGGSIVNMPGDLTICIIQPGTTDILEQLTWYVVTYLRNRGINIVLNENDILADGKKVISWASVMNLFGWSQAFIHFSIGPMDLDLVNAICTKPMVKIPGSLGEYEITAEDILEEINKFFE